MKNITNILMLRYFNFQILNLTIKSAFQKRIVGLSSEIAYYALLALFPALITIFTALGFFQDSIEKTLLNLLNQYQDVFPSIVWELLKDFIFEITQSSNKSLLSLSLIASIWISSSALSSTMNAMDQIQGIPIHEKRPFWKAKLTSIFITISALFLLILASILILLGDYIIQLSLFLIQKLPVDNAGGYLLLKIWRLLNWPFSFGIIAIFAIYIYKFFKQKEDKFNRLRKIKTFLIGLVIIVLSLIILITFLIFIENLIRKVSGDYYMAFILIKIWQVLSWPIALTIVALAFAFIYRIGTSRWKSGTPLLPGAFLAAISWAIISGVFRLYVSNFGLYNKIYGAFGAIIVLMLWLQISALVMLIGYQLNIIIRDTKYNSKQLP